MKSGAVCSPALWTKTRNVLQHSWSYHLWQASCHPQNTLWERLVVWWHTAAHIPCLSLYRVLLYMRRQLLAQRDYRLLIGWCKTLPTHSKHIRDHRHKLLIKQSVIILVPVPDLVFFLVYDFTIAFFVLSCLVFRGGLRDDDSYSVRIQVLTPMVFKAPDNFFITYYYVTANRYQIWATQHNASHLFWPLGYTVYINAYHSFKIYGTPIGFVCSSHGQCHQPSVSLIQGYYQHYTWMTGGYTIYKSDRLRYGK